MHFKVASSQSQRPWLAFGLGLLLNTRVVTAIQLDLSSEDSIKAAAGVAAHGLVAWYNGNETGGIPGNLPDPFYWWEAGAMFMSLIDYWYYTGDAQYNTITTEAILWQVGPNNDFMTPNQTKTEGNDDQAFWAFAAMTAAEQNFPNPSDDQPQWLALAQAVFNLQAARWDTSTCGGGLKWQIYPFNAGYTYKNIISNGCFFNLASRLYRYTGNETYHDWAIKMYDWVEDIGLLGDTYEAYDGTDDTINCTRINHLKWTYNAGVFLHGMANMWNKTSDPIWQSRVNGVITTLPYFFSNGSIMYETLCEPTGICNNDQQSFKAYLSRWMAGTVLLAPWTSSVLLPYLSASAVAAAAQCSGGESGNVCGMQWTQGAVYDGNTGPGQQMAAMQVIAANLITTKTAPVTNTTGGTSKGDSSAGTTGDASSSEVEGLRVITKGDRVGAWILTVGVGVTVLAGAIWVCW